MGSCLSCFGLLRLDHDDDENPETSRLLSNDPYRDYAGLDSRHARSRDAQHHHLQPNPEVLRRERQALEGLCHSMSDEAVDGLANITASTTADMGRGGSQRAGGSSYMIAQWGDFGQPGAPPGQEAEDEDEEELEEEEYEDEEDSKVQERWANGREQQDHGDESDIQQSQLIGPAIEDAYDLPTMDSHEDVQRLRSEGFSTYLNKIESEAAKIAMG